MHDNAYMCRFAHLDELRGHVRVHDLEPPPVRFAVRQERFNVDLHSEGVKRGQEGGRNDSM
eukprot:5606594-Pyramimonas_sp.AAC.2